MTDQKQTSLNLEKLTYPIKSPVVRRELVKNFDLCPECGDELDTGWECIECGYDAEHLGYTDQEKANDKVVERLAGE